MGYLKRQRFWMSREAYKAKRRREKLQRMGFSSEEAYRAAKKLSSLSRGTYNRDAAINTSAYIGGSGGTIKRDSVSDSRTFVYGDGKAPLPYHRVVYKNSGTSFVGVKAHYVNPWNDMYLNLCRAYSDTDAAWWGGYDVTVQRRADLISRSQSALLSRIRQDMPTWDILTDAVELKKTLSSIKGASTWTATLIKHVSKRDVGGIIRHLRLHENKRTRKRVSMCVLLPKGDQGKYDYKYFIPDYRSPVRVIDAMSNLWMSYRYSMMTVIYSMQDALIALAAPKRAKDYENKVQVTLKDDISSSGSVWLPCYGIGYTSFKYGDILRISGSIRKKAFYSFYESLVDRLNPDTLISLTKTAFEIIPYSWVADWFLGISDYLSLLELHNLLCKSSVVITEKGSVYRSVYFMDVDAGGSKSVKDFTITLAPSNGVFTSTSFYFDRSLGNVSAPQWAPTESWYTWKRGLDSSALAWNNIKHKLMRAI